MRVSFNFTDKIDTYSIEAEVSSTNRVQLLSVEDSYGSDVDPDDFSESEMRGIYAKAYAARDDLDSSEDPAYSDETGDDATEGY